MCAQGTWAFVGRDGVFRKKYLSPDPLRFYIDCFFFFKESHFISVEFTKWYIPQGNGNDEFILEQLTSRCAVFFLILERKGDFKGFMGGFAGHQTRFSEQTAFFIRSSTHFFSFTHSARERHIDTLFVEYYFIIRGFRGHIQDQPIWSRSAVRDDMPRFVVHRYIDNADRNNSFGFILAPEHRPAFDFNVESHFNHGIVLIGLHVMAKL